MLRSPNAVRASRSMGAASCFETPAVALSHSLVDRLYMKRGSGGLLSMRPGEASQFHQRGSFMRDKPCLTATDVSKAMSACKAEAERNKWAVSIAIVDD